MSNEYQSYYRKEVFEVLDCAALKTIEKTGTDPENKDRVFPILIGIMALRKAFIEELEEHDKSDL